VSIPVGWSWMRFSEVGRIAANLVDPAEWPHLPHIAPDNISRDTGKLLSFRTVREDGVMSAKHRFYPGQLLYSKIRPYLNKCVQVSFEGLCSADMYPVDALIDPSFLHYYMLTREFVRQVGAAAGSRTVLPKTNQKQMADVPVPVAPLAEQRRIVDTLDSHLTRLDDALSALERTRAKLRAYRSSVLRSAVEGRLVPTEASLARIEGRKMEPADAQLARLLNERRHRWEQAELSRLKAVGKTPKGDKWKGRYQEPKLPATSNLHQLPEGWCWTSAEVFFWDADYGTSEKCTPTGDGNAVLRIPNVSGGHVSLDDIKYASRDAELRSDGAVEPNDFLFIRTNGSRSLIGRGALIVRQYDPAVHFASYLIRLRLVDLESTAGWFALVWHGPSVREQLLRCAGSSAGQHNVSLSAVSSFVMPLPPPSEQVRILAEVDRLTSAATKTEEQITLDLRRCRRLREAVLKWAFEGKLTDQDSADEPAEKLLGRIRAEHGVVPGRKTGDRQARGAP
jgi:type I restriction enzyme, S subunit